MKCGLRDGDSRMENRKCFVLILYSLAQCLYWACGCAAISFSVVYLTSKGFSQAETGMICSAAAALSFFLTGRMACVLDAKKAGPLPVGVGLFSVIALSLAAANFITHAGLITATLYTLAVAGLQSAIFYYNELYAVFSHQGIFLNFGAARALGSVSFSAASTLLGILIQRHGAGFLPAIACILAILQIACMLVLCRISRAPTQTETVPPTSRTSVLRFLRQHRRFARFLLGASLVSAGNLTLTTFLIHIVERAGGSPWTLGALNAYMALIEIPVMFCYARIRK